MIKAIILGGILLFILVIVLRNGAKRKKKLAAYQLPPDAGEILEQHVSFYRKLEPARKKIFQSRLRTFLSKIKVTGVGVTVTDLDRLLVASSAIIPIEAFPDWEYRNINEVLLYPGTFSREYALEGYDRNVLGMVGSGAMNGQMILSQPALRYGFEHEDGHNTGIHEFVHLIDKADGAVDGIPEYLLDRPHIKPWLNAMHEEISRMRTEDTDINPYGATNDAEFFAVMSEYFFERPEELQEQHPELYRMLSTMFGQTVSSSGKQ